MHILAYITSYQKQQHQQNSSKKTHLKQSTHSLDILTVRSLQLQSSGVEHLASGLVVEGSVAEDDAHHTG